MKIAVASKSGREVDQHFGHAERFIIYEVNAIETVARGEVSVEKYCSYDPEHPFRHRQFTAIIMALRECQVVVTAMIGDYPLAELRKAGLFHLTATGPIGDALQIAARGRL